MCQSQKRGGDTFAQPRMSQVGRTQYIIRIGSVRPTASIARCRLLQFNGCRVVLEARHRTQPLHGTHPNQVDDPGDEPGSPTPCTTPVPLRYLAFHEWARELTFWAPSRQRENIARGHCGLEVIEEDDSMNNRNNVVWPNGIPQIGQKAQRSRAVAARDIELFTEISGDRNPLHYDVEAARATRFGGIVVQGGVTSAILNAVVAEDLPRRGRCFYRSIGTSRRLFGPAIPSRGGQGDQRAGRQADRGL